jgi:phage-related protein
MKPLKFVGNSLNDLKSFPKPAQKEAGHQLNKVQEGKDPSDWKPMKTIGTGVREIRIQIRDQYRIIYTASFTDAVYVLHAFLKKTQKTTKRDLDTAAQRLKAVQKTRGENDGNY